ncbi:hypothetical protein SeLEV6574_g03446 [Synchytrium endobioticum]|nr:hypothetical protein SeLEV6574_g03446 [Synchytrium endobioticum]
MWKAPVSLEYTTIRRRGCRVQLPIGDAPCRWLVVELNLSSNFDKVDTPLSKRQVSEYIQRGSRQQHYFQTSSMSLGGGFGGGGNNLAIAEQELEMVTSLFNNIVDACHKKCIVPKYADGDLNKGESVCVDRCVAKYLEVNKIIGEKFGAIAQQAQQGQTTR